MTRGHDSRFTFHCSRAVLLEREHTCLSEMTGRARGCGPGRVGSGLSGRPRVCCPSSLEGSRAGRAAGRACGGETPHPCGWSAGPLVQGSCSGEGQGLRAAATVCGGSDSGHRAWDVLVSARGLSIPFTAPTPLTSHFQMCPVW